MIVFETRYFLVSYSRMKKTEKSLFVVVNQRVSRGNAKLEL